MKKVLLSVLLILGLALPAQAVSVPSLSFAPDASEYTVGDIVTVDINISDLLSPLASYDFDVMFDDAILAFQNHALGSELGPDSFEFGFGDLGGGMISLAEATTNDISAQPASFTLATLTFEAAAVGQADLSFSVIDDIDQNLFQGFFDESSMDMGVDFTDTAIITVNAVPVPSTIGLLSFGLLGLAGMIRRNR